MEPVLFEQDDPRQRGRAHGELWRPQIRELAEIRKELTLQRGAFTTMPQVLDVAMLHLPPLQEHAPAMYEELVGIAEGADLPIADAVVLNHYTDLKDYPAHRLSGASSPSIPDDGGCTAIYVNGVDGPLLGQTWDMHASAEPFVRMIQIRPRGGR